MFSLRLVLVGIAALLLSAAVVEQPTEDRGPRTEEGTAGFPTPEATHARWSTDTGARSTVTSTSYTEGNDYVYEYTVTAAAGETIKDFHILPVPKSKWRPDGVPQTNTEGTGGSWTASKSRGGIHWVATGGGLTGGQSVKLKIKVKSGFTDQPVKWVTTSDGNNDPKDGEVDHGPQGGQNPPDKETRGPTMKVVLGPAGDPPHIGTTFEMALATDFPQRPFTIYAMNVEPDDYLSQSDFTAFLAAHPVPAGWGLDFSGFAGSETGDDGEASASIVIPNNGNLIGESIWLVPEVSLEEGEGVIAGPAFKVTFVQ